MINSLTQPKRYYVGMTEDLEERLQSHNFGLCNYTANFVPWHIETAIAFK